MILLLTDCPQRGQRLARSFSQVRSSLVIDLLDPEQSCIQPNPAAVRAIVCDLSFAESGVIAGLRAQLRRFGTFRPPLFCVRHEETARFRTHVGALQATRVIDASEAAGALAAILTPLTTEAVTRGDEIDRDVAGADTVLSRLFDLSRNGATVAPALIEAGADYIGRALRKADVRTWLDVVWRFDDATHQHCLLVAGFVAGFAQQLGMRHSDCQLLTQAALLHDIGKARVPLTVLNKPGSLTELETRIMREHPVLGAEMLRAQNFRQDLLAVVRSHHEFLDGSGYPDGLAGVQIHDIVRLVTICDIFGALVERRPYKAPMPGAQAYAILEGMGDKLDRDLVRAFRPLAVQVGADTYRASP